MPETEALKGIVEPEKPFDEWDPNTHTSAAEVARAKPTHQATPRITRAGRVIQVPSRELLVLESRERAIAYRLAVRVLQAERIFRDIIYFKHEPYFSPAMKKLEAQLDVPVASSAEPADKRLVLTPTHPVLASGLRAWPRLLQVGSFYLTIGALLAANRVIGSDTGAAIAFFGLFAFCFANFAAWRKGLPNLLLGPYVAVLGMWGSLIISAAVMLNILIGP